MVLLVAAMVEDEDTTPTKIKVSDLKEKEIELGQREEALAARWCMQIELKRWCVCVGPSAGH